MTTFLSASDWTRMQRRKSAFIVEKTSEVHKQTPASKWINNVGANKEDIVTKSFTPVGPKFTLTRFCKCTEPIILNPKVGVCTKCNKAQHLRLN